MDKNDGEEMAMLFLKFINNMSANEEDFVKGLCDSHRTLQQSIMRVFMKFVTEMAKKEEGFYDLRNEASVKLARKIMALDDIYLPFI